MSEEKQGEKETADNGKKKVVLVCTNGAYLQDHATGLWLEECSAPYYAFVKAGLDVEIASPLGGPIPIDAASLRGAFFVQSARQFLHDADAMDKLHHSIKVGDIDFSAETGNVDALYLAAGHGTCVDFVDCPPLKEAIETMHANATKGKVVAAVCHAPIALVQCKDTTATSTDKEQPPLVKGKVVTGFSDSEEQAVQLADLVPFMLESKLKELGAKYERADNDWNSKVCVDGNLITGQNPQSSDDCAKAVLDKLLPPKPKPAAKAAATTTTAATTNGTDSNEDGVVFC